MATNPSKASYKAKEISERVSKARKALGLSQEEVGERLGLTRAGYGHYESSRQPFTVEQLFQLARILEKPITYFLGIEVGLGEQEAELVHVFRELLDDEGREVMMDMAHTLARRRVPK